MTKYNSPEAFRTALEAKIRSASKGEDISVHRKRAAFAAFLKRVEISGHDFALKGGFAMMLRFDVNARPSKDMDFVMRARRKTGDTDLSPVLQVASALEEISDTEAPDFFTFEVKGNPKALRGGGYGAWRFQIEGKIGARRFESFHIDIALGDAWIDPMDKIDVDYFPIDGDPRFSVKAISKSQQFAEKLHAYTLPIEGNSRVKDLVDMVILARSGLDVEQTGKAIGLVFSSRGTHLIPEALQAPPEEWESPFLELVKSCGLGVKVDEAFVSVQEFYEKTVV